MTTQENKTQIGAISVATNEFRPAANHATLILDIHSSVTAAIVSLSVLPPVVAPRR